MDAILNCSRLLDTDGRPDRKFSSFGRMLLIDERPYGYKGTKLIDLNSAPSNLEAHN
jgi:hypothetical protein